MFDRLSPIRFTSLARKQIEVLKLPKIEVESKLEAMRMSLLACPTAGRIIDRFDIKGADLDAGQYAFAMPIERRGVEEVLDLFYFWLSHDHSIIVSRAATRAVHDAPIALALQPDELKQIEEALNAARAVRG